MKKHLILTIAALVFISFSSNYAQTKRPKVTKQQINQQKRIYQGVKSGELTKKEAVKLQRNQIKLQKNKKKAKADGIVTKKKRAKLHRQANRNCKKIYIQKHDKQKRK